MKVQVFNRFDINQMSIVVLSDDGDRYNFKTKSFDVRTCRYEELTDDNQILIPIDMYKEIAMVIKKDNSVPDPEKSFCEGKLEATESHLADLQKLVFEERYTVTHEPTQQPNQ